MNASFQPKCQNDIMISYPTQKKNQSPQHQRVPFNHFFFMHRNYLCFVSHAIFHNLRQYTSQTTSSSLSIGHQLKTTNNIKQEEKVSHTTYHELYFNEIMTISTIISQLSGTTVSTFPLLSPFSSSFSSPPSNHQSPTLSMKQVYSTNNLINAQYKNEVFNTILNYFGILPPKPTYWCDESIFIMSSDKKGSIGDGDDDSGNGGDLHCNKEDVLLQVEDIPWMMKDGFGYDICPSKI